MSKHNLLFHDKVGQLPKISLNICFLDLSEEFIRDSERLQISQVNESSVFESKRFYCIFNMYYRHFTPQSFHIYPVNCLLNGSIFCSSN